MPGGVTIGFVSRVLMQQVLNNAGSQTAACTDASCRLFLAEAGSALPTPICCVKAGCAFFNS